MSCGDDDSCSAPDPYISPMVERAMQAAKAVLPGTVVSTVFSAFDMSELIGLEGASFIAKLPESAPPNQRLYIGEQWFVQGHATSPLKYDVKYVDDYVEKTRCWLLDVVIMRNWFAKGGDQDVHHIIRAKSLDSSRGRFGRSGPLSVPPGRERQPLDVFLFHVAHVMQPLRVGEDIPLGLWVLRHKNEQTDFESVATITATAPMAWVLYVRFQESAPPNTV